MKILVVGGTRYFGIPMVNALLKNDHDITIATRGNSKPEFDSDISYVVIDRMDSASINNGIPYASVALSVLRLINRFGCPACSIGVKKLKLTFDD